MELELLQRRKRAAGGEESQLRRAGSAGASI